MPVARRSFFVVIASMLFSCRKTSAKGQHLRTYSKTNSTTFTNLISSVENPYDRWWSKGGELAAADFKSPYLLLQSEGIFDKNGLKLLSSAISKTHGDIVLNVDSPDPAGLRKLIEVCTQHKTFFVTQNNLPPPDLRPWVTSPYYVAHIDFDQTLAGVRTGQQLIVSMGGKGGIVALNGKADNTSSSKRLAGFRQALSSAPKCHLLASPIDAEWESSTAYDIMRSLIAQYDDGQIGGVWAANDDMALGAIEALRLYGLSVPVTGMDGKRQAIDAIQGGTMTATVAWDSFWQGGIGLALAFYAKRGLIDVSQARHFQRAFYAPFELVTLDNALSFIDYRDAEHPVVDWSDFWGRSTGPIPDD